MHRPLTHDLNRLSSRVISLFQGNCTMSHEGLGIHSPRPTTKIVITVILRIIYVVAGADLDFVLALVLLLEFLEYFL